MNKITFTDGVTPLNAANLNQMQTNSENAINEVKQTADAALPASSYTASDVLTKIKTVDGTGSGLDADTLDGKHAAQTPQTTEQNDIIGMVNELNGNKAKAQQENWQAPTLVNNWINFGGNDAPAGYYKNSLGEVFLRGMIKGGTTTAGTQIFILPTGYRPEYDMQFPVVANNAFGAIYVKATGVVEISVASAYATSLSGIHFRAAS